MRRLLRRDHGSELEISLYPADRFFNRDYGMFDCSGVALIEAVTSPVNPHISKARDSNCPTAQTQRNSTNTKLNQTQPNSTNRLTACRGRITLSGYLAMGELRPVSTPSLELLSRRKATD
jgi:hypothetical protein